MTIPNGRTGREDTNREDSLPLVSIIIPAYNAASTIRLCLDAVTQLDYPGYETIVVDNNSSDDTPQIVQQYPVRLLYERDVQGPHAATNTGIRAARGDVIAFTDADCVPDASWLRALVAPFTDPHVVAAGGRIEAYQPASPVECFLDHMKPYRNCLRLAEDFPASLLTGNAAYRTEALHAVGLFNANMYTGAEVSLAWQVQWMTGQVVVYVPEALVYHKFPPTVRWLFQHYRKSGVSEIMLATIYKRMPDYPSGPRQQLSIMARQVRALLTYMASMALRTLRIGLHRSDRKDVLSPALWLVAEAGSLLGKIEALWQTRWYRRQFWSHHPQET